MKDNCHIVATGPDRFRGVCLAAESFGQSRRAIWKIFPDFNIVAMTTMPFGGKIRKRE